MSERVGQQHWPTLESNGGSPWESNPAAPHGGTSPVLKTGRATGPRSLPAGRGRLAPTARRLTPLAEVERRLADLEQTA